MSRWLTRAAVAVLAIGALSLFIANWTTALPIACAIAALWLALRIAWLALGWVARNGNKPLFHRPSLTEAAKEEIRKAVQDL